MPRPSGSRPLPGLDPALLARLTSRLRGEEPAAVAVLVGGSYVRGSADEESDLDLVAVTGGEPTGGYRTWLVERPGSRPLHVSAGAVSVEGWLPSARKPRPWALGFPALFVARYVWAEEGAIARLGEDPSVLHPPAPPELEDVLEGLLKARRAGRAGDGAGLRFFAHHAATLAPRLLRPLNPERVVHDRREALEAALALPLVPPHYRRDLSLCLGLQPASDGAVAQALLRLGREILAVLRERKPDVDPQPELPRYLAEGSLERLLA